MERVDKILNHPTFRKTIKKLKKVEQDRIYCIHDMEHLLNVARIMMIQNLEENLRFEKEVIYAVALLHDIGRLNQYKTKEKHAIFGSKMAYDILLECDFDEKLTAEMCLAIKTHSGNEDTNDLGILLRIADKLSRNCFICVAEAQCNWSYQKKNRSIYI